MTRPSPPPDQVLSYGTHPDQVADLRVAGGPDPGDILVLFLHGGFWRHEYDRQHTGPLATALAQDGISVASLEYRRTGAPGGGWPGTFDDVAAGVAAVPALAARYARVDRVVLAGHSAGGQLALWAASQPAAQQAGVRGVVGLASCADLREAYRLDLDEGAVIDLLGGGPDEVPDRYAAADPVALVPLRTRVHLVHGLADRHMPPDLSRRYLAAARQAGAEVGLTELPDMDHFSMIDPLSPAWPVVMGALRGAAADSPVG
jgi:acetyl esterase/lipase